MKKSWPFVVAVVIVGGLAGVAIAGRPVPSDQFVLDPNATVADSPTSTSLVSATTPSTTEATTTTEASTTTAIPTTTGATTTSAVSTTTAAPTTTVAPTPSTVPGPLPRDQVRLVVANGDGRFKLASTTADRLRALGYVVDIGDVANTVDATVIYYRPDFDDEAAFAAVDLNVPDALILPLPTTGLPITTSDANGDVIIVLGPDAPR